ncbi:MAG: asparagine synthase (glutamine-hydrolyzing) [Candidatus Omnitrophota bacterium]
MCGIFGKYNYLSSKPLSRDLLERMSYSLMHRGPDDVGIFLEAEIGFGARRLNITGGPKGVQPIFNEERNIAIVFNGEIYNYKELKHVLSAKKHNFKTETDTEVIVHLYEEFGIDCLNKLNGMFSFAIWDKNKKSLFLARDRIGIKPLFYSIDVEGLIFASEIKAILLDPNYKKEIDIDALSDFLAHSYVRAPRTMFNNIKLLEPGQYILCSKEKEIITKKYWSIPDADFLKNTMSDTEQIDKFRYLLEQSVKRQVPAESQAGILLSGGLDSSSIAYFASHLSKTPVKAFCVGFGESSFDQRPFAEQTSRYLGLDLETIKFNISAADLIQSMSSLDRLQAYPAIMPTHYICRFIKEKAGINVVLSGEGADELLGGYETYIADKLYYYYKRIFPYSLSNSLLTSLGENLPAFEYPLNMGYKIKRFLLASSYAGNNAVHDYWRETFYHKERTRILNGDVQRFLNKRLEPNSDDFKADKKFILNEFLRADIKQLLPDVMLARIDSMSMASGLEVRVPFLDNDLLDFIFAIPDRLKLKGLTTKYILKRAMEGRLAKDIIYRKKRGLSVPISKWIRHELKDFILDHLSSKKIKDVGVFNENYIKSILNDHFALKKDNSLKIWALLSFFIWHDNFMKDGMQQHFVLK